MTAVLGHGGEDKGCSQFLQLLVHLWVDEQLRLAGQHPCRETQSGRLLKGTQFIPAGDRTSRPQNICS